MSGFSDANTFLKSDLFTAQYPPNPSTARGVGTQINSHPDKPLIIYPSGKFVVVRDLSDVSKSFVYRGHSFDPTVAAFSPSGAWIASADAGGKVKVWAWSHPDKLTKLDTQLFSGAVADLCWSPDNNKIVAVGDNGGGLQMKTFTYDTGNSLGEMVGHNKRVTACAYKPTRPFKIMTGGEDLKTVFFSGPPFKMGHSNNTHTNFVNAVRYTPDGARIVSVGSDKKIQLYDGVTGEPTEAIENAHAASIYQACISSDSSKMLTVSADKTAKMWDLTASPPTATQTFTFTNHAGEAAAQVGDMQVSCTFVAGLNSENGGSFLTLSLHGTLNLLSEADPSPAGCKQISGPQGFYTAAAYNAAINTVYGGDPSGCLFAVPLSGAESVCIKGDAVEKRSVTGSVHDGQVTGIVAIQSSVADGGDGGDVLLCSSGFDDKIRFTTVKDGRMVSDVESTLDVGAQPRKLASGGGKVAVLTSQAVLFINPSTRSILGRSALSFCSGQIEAKSIALSSDGAWCAIGGSDFKTHVFLISRDTNELGAEVACLETRSAVTALSFTDDSTKLAVGDAGKQLEVFNTADWSCQNKGKWVFHTSTISALQWDPSGSVLLSGALDEKLILWDGTDATWKTKTEISFAHRNGVVAAGFKGGAPYAAGEPTQIFSVGDDGVVAEFSFPSA